ncbi:hypothetical protein [Vibrio cidicii]
MPAVYNAIQKKVKRGLYSAQVETLLPEGSVESREAAAYLVRILIDAGYAATIEPIRDSSFLEPTPKGFARYLVNVQWGAEGGLQLEMFV